MTIAMTKRERELSEMQPAAFCAGIEAERRRCSALARLGEVADAATYARTAIEKAHTVEDSVAEFRRRATAQGNSRELERAVAQLGLAAPNADASAAPTVASAERDMGDIVADMLDAQRGAARS
jgi:hypothetical protein